jgi:hypothetical protein
MNYCLRALKRGVRSEPAIDCAKIFPRQIGQASVEVRRHEVIGQPNTEDPRGGNPRVSRARQHGKGGGHRASSRPGDGPNAEKVRRLHGLAQAALDGRLDTERLRVMAPDAALASLRELPGVGPFTADAVLYRGCGVVDGLPASDELGQTVIHDVYELPSVSATDVDRITDRWRPYRMWAVVLLRMGWTRAQGGNVSYRRG